jgi:uncharacterized protein (DUF433 family)
MRAEAPRAAHLNQPETFAMPVVAIEHIDVDARGVARIVGKRTKVIQIVMDRMAYGWGPEEIHAQHPHLSLSQIYAAFAYYYDHKAELDAQIEADIRRADEMRAQAGESAIVQKIKRLADRPDAPPRHTAGG